MNRANESDRLAMNRRRLLRGLGVAGLSTLATSTVASADSPDPIEELLGEDGGGDDGDQCHHVVDQDGSDGEYETIQAAVDAAVPGDNVCVLAGEYEEQVAVDTDDLVLWGVRGPDATTIRASGTVVDVTGEGVVLGNFGIDARDATGIDAGEGTGVRNCRVETRLTNGIEARDVNLLGVVGNVFYNDLPYGELPAESGYAIDARRVRGTTGSDPSGGGFFQGNEFYRYDDGVLLEDCRRVLLRSNYARFNRIGTRVRSTEQMGSADTIYFDRNEYDRNGTAILSVESGDSEIRSIVAEGNVFDNFVFGVFTSTGWVTYEGEEALAAGEMTEPFHAPCNYWGHPTGPKRRDNPYSNRNWFTRQAVDNGDGVTEGVEVRPWAAQPIDPDEEVLCHGGRISGQF